MKASYLMSPLKRVSILGLPCRCETESKDYPNVGESQSQKHLETVRWMYEGRDHAAVTIYKSHFCCDPKFSNTFIFAWYSSMWLQYGRRMHSFPEWNREYSSKFSSISCPAAPQTEFLTPLPVLCMMASRKKTSLRKCTSSNGKEHFNFNPFFISRGVRPVELAQTQTHAHLA